MKIAFKYSHVNKISKSRVLTCFELLETCRRRQVLDFIKCDFKIRLKFAQNVCKIGLQIPN